jgi:surfactin synthase thioesterase subunit
LGKLAPFTDWETMLAAAKVAVARLEPLPLAFFGHSLGALVALDLARATPPDRLAALFCAARPSPGAPAPDRAAFDGATSTDDFVARLVAAYGEAPASFSDPDIRDYALPILKADLQLLRSRRSERRPPLKAPLTIFAGAQDPVTKGDLSAWRAETTGPFDIVTIGAGHYFLETEKARIAAEISRRLDAL